MGVNVGVGASEDGAGMEKDGVEAV